MSKAQWIKENLKTGELYAGIVLGKEGAPDHHLILLSGEAEKLKFDAANKWATKVGGELPTRPEQALLYANLKEEFKPAWYWSGTQHAAYSHYAWYQSFYYGGQVSSSKSAELCARAVRRIYIGEVTA